MGDHVEVPPQISPETPGRPYVRNPFESPTDYQQLREALVPSPSVFRSKSCKSTPPRFDWSIDEMASLLPVHIDQEEIQLQSFYLSQTRMDSDIEAKRQNAIEQFFTKGTIVPSPWATAQSRKHCQLQMKSCGSDVIAEEPEKNSVSCQTTLSLPLSFDLEKVLGDHFHRGEEACEAVQESLSSSSLRRKLFLDGQASHSGSESSGPPSPERSYSREECPPLGQGGRAQEEQEQQEEQEEQEQQEAASVTSSPLACGRLAQTPSTGQFSSSPIQNGRFRDYSLGSITSPPFPDRSSPAGLASPMLSPIAVVTDTPSSADRKQAGGARPCSHSPFVEGCSPIRSCSPRTKPRPRVRSRLSPPLISPILNPKLQEEEEEEEELPPCSSFPPMDLDPPPPSGHDPQPGEALDRTEPLKMEEDEQDGMEGRLEEDGGESSGQLTSSRMANVSGAEVTHMCVSVLTEGSSLRYDSSMQVDSGYSTTSAGAASLDSDSHLKDASNVAEEAPQVRHFKVKVFYPHL